MERRNTNRANHLPIEKQYIKGISIEDVDSTIINYMSKTVIPDVIENGVSIKVPLIYGNSERWESARKDGYLRDERGKMQTPVLMIKRGTIAKNDSMIHLKDQLTIPTQRKYSSTNRYDRLNLINNAKPKYEIYNVAMPSYVTVEYDVVIWTSFIEQMNTIVEAFQFIGDRYWGEPDKYKFRVTVNDFDNQTEVSAGTERVVKTSFTLSVNAYLLPDSFNNIATVKKSLSARKVTFGIETDMTTGTSSVIAPNAMYNEYQSVVDFISMRGSKSAVFVDATTIKLTNVYVPELPTDLIGIFDTSNWYSVYINGQFEPSNFYTYSYNGSTHEVTFVFSNLGFALDNTDEIYITGRFQEL